MFIIYLFSFKKKIFVKKDPWKDWKFSFTKNFPFLDNLKQKYNKITIEGFALPLFSLSLIPNSELNFCEIEWNLVQKQSFFFFASTHKGDRDLNAFSPFYNWMVDNRMPVSPFYSIKQLIWMMIICKGWKQKANTKTMRRYLGLLNWETLNKSNSWTMNKMTKKCR